jgi:hypothetical protein
LRPILAGVSTSHSIQNLKKEEIMYQSGSDMRGRTVECTIPQHSSERIFWQRTTQREAFSEKPRIVQRSEKNHRVNLATDMTFHRKII